jgi:hypothetical protein
MHEKPLSTQVHNFMQKLFHTNTHADSPSPTCPYVVQEKENEVVLVNPNLGGFNDVKKLGHFRNIKISEI